MANCVDVDAIIVGAGPNGLAAAITLAQAGCSVWVLEAEARVGGAARSASLSLPGFVHDVGSAIHPLALGSPFFETLPLERYGLRWIHPRIPLAHPLDGGRAVRLCRSVDETAAALGSDEGAYRRLMAPLVAQWPALRHELLQPVLHLPRHPVPLVRFGVEALQSARGLAERTFATEPARALFAGLAAHASLPLTWTASAAFGLVLGMAGHAVGWPMPRGGAQRISDALAAYLRDLGGIIRTDERVAHVDQLPPSRVVLLDVTPRQVLQLAGERLPASYRRRLERYRYGAGVFKLDYALDGPIPWQAPACAEAGTVHLGGTLAAIARGEEAVQGGKTAPQPFVLLAQHSLFDPTRAPEGKHTAWAYCHVPNGSTEDMTARIEAQIERFAPGFRARIRARSAMGPARLERLNANLVGGDINGGMQDLRQLLARPVLTWNPYRTPVDGLYLCSSSTPPGGGVHGMCGHLAARAALRAMR